MTIEDRRPISQVNITGSVSIIYYFFWVQRLLIQTYCANNPACVTLRGRIKEAARTLRKQDPAFPENRENIPAQYTNVQLVWRENIPAQYTNVQLVWSENIPAQYTYVQLVWSALNRCEVCFKQVWSVL